MTSGMPPTRVAIGTTSQAMPSSAASPNDSSSLGSSRTSARASFSLHLVLLAQKHHVVVNAFLHRQPFRARAVGTVADQQQLGGNLLAHPVKDLDGVGHALHRTEIRKMHQQALAVGRVLLRELRRIFASAIHVAIHEVVNDLDVILDVELAQRALPQVLRDGGDAVALLDGEARDRQIRAVQTDQRDVGAVKRGDERQLAPRGLAASIWRASSALTECGIA